MQNSANFRAWFALGCLIIVMLFMCMAQVRSEILPDTSPLYDLGFQIFPELSHLVWSTVTFWQTIADVWLFVMLVVFILLVFFGDTYVFTETAALIKSRHTMCLVVVYALRTLVLLCNRYPRAIDPFFAKNDIYSDYHDTFTAALLVLVGARTTVTDYMFSGHTSSWILMACTVSHYSRSIFLSIFWWLLTITGIILLICVRTHYTSDVLIGIFVTSLIFTVYHASVDPERTWIVQVIKWWEKEKKMKKSLF